MGFIRPVKKTAHERLRASVLRSSLVLLRSVLGLGGAALRIVLAHERAGSRHDELFEVELLQSFLVLIREAAGAIDLTEMGVHPS